VNDDLKDAVDEAVAQLEQIEDLRRRFRAATALMSQFRAAELRVSELRDEMAAEIYQTEQAVLGAKLTKRPPLVEIGSDVGMSAMSISKMVRRAVRRRSS
jgi:hypothetical protein